MSAETAKNILDELLPEVAAADRVTRKRVLKKIEEVLRIPTVACRLHSNPVLARTLAAYMARQAVAEILPMDEARTKALLSPLLVAFRTDLLRESPFPPERAPALLQELTMVFSHASELDMPINKPTVVSFPMPDRTRKVENEQDIPLELYGKGKRVFGATFGYIGERIAGKSDYEANTIIRHLLYIREGQPVDLFDLVEALKEVQSFR